MNQQPVSSAGQIPRGIQKINAGALLSDGQARCHVSTNKPMPAHHPLTVDGQEHPEITTIGLPSTDHLLNADHDMFEIHDMNASVQPPSGEGQIPDENHLCCADSTPLDDDGQHPVDHHGPNSEVVTPRHRDPAVVAHVRHLYKQRNDIIRAHGNLTRQVISICRHSVGFNTFLPEKERAAAQKAGDALLAKLKAGSPEAAHVFDSAGFLLDVIEKSGFTKQKTFIEKKMATAAKVFGMDEFINSVPGLSATMLCTIIGEAGDLANYGTKSRLWKRLGLAVIDGVRQSKQSDAGKALDHGYNPSRRAAVWNIGESVIKQQVRAVKNEAGENTGSIAIGPLGKVYLDRKAEYAAKHPEKSKKHIHNDAKRYMEKRLIAQLWRAWNS
jgi:hypothetical protein